MNLALWLLSSALGLFVVLCLRGIRETNALLRPSYTPMEAALYNRYPDIIHWHMSVSHMRVKLRKHLMKEQTCPMCMYI